MDASNDRTFVTNEQTKLSKNKKLYDLNKDFTNFEVVFEINAKGPIQFTIINQEALDNSGEIKYNNASGSIRDKIVINNNQFQNYFLILKAASTEEIDCEIKILSRELPQNIPPPQQQTPPQQEATRQSQHQEVSPRQHPEMMENFQKETLFSKTWFKVFLGAIILAVGFYIYNTYFTESRQAPAPINNTPIQIILPPQPAAAPAPVEIQPAPIVQPTAESTTYNISQDQNKRFTFSRETGDKKSTYSFDPSKASSYNRLMDRLKNPN